MLVEGCVIEIIFYCYLNLNLSLKAGTRVSSLHIFISQHAHRQAIFLLPYRYQIRNFYGVNTTLLFVSLKLFLHEVFLKIKMPLWRTIILHLEVQTIVSVVTKSIV